MKILIIDDSDYKITSLQQFLVGSRDNIQLHVARSFQSGLAEIQEFHPELILLDMTLPTSETEDGQLEGRMRIFGGRDLLEEMELDETDAKVIIVTQFDQFGQHPNTVDRATLFTNLQKRFPNYILGGVYYSNVDSIWKKQLAELMNRTKPNKL